MTGLKHILPEEIPDELKNRSPLWRAFVRFGLIPLVAFFYFTASLHFEYTPDETYIYLQYARNIAAGNGFVFNEQLPSNGIPGPLWVLLIAAGTAGGLDPFIVAKTLDLLFASLSILLVYAVAYGVLRDRIYAILAACLLACDSWMLQWAGSGTETSLGVLLVLLAFWYVYKNEYVLASLASAVLTLVRPEGAVLFVLIQIDYVFLVRDPRSVRRMMPKTLVVFTAILVPWLTYAVLVFGTPVPEIFSPSLDSALFIAAIEMRNLLVTQGPALMALILGLVASFRRVPLRGLRIEVFPLSWVFALWMFSAMINVQVVSRYLLLATPIVVIFGLWGVKKIQEFWKLEWRWTVVAFGALVLFTFGQNIYVYSTSVVPHIRGFEESMNQCIRPMANWLKENTDPGATVLAPDIGLLAYVSERRVFATSEEGKKGGQFRTVLRPDYIIEHSLKPSRLKTLDRVPVMTREFSSPAIAGMRPVYYTLYKVVR